MRWLPLVLLVGCDLSTLGSGSWSAGPHPCFGNRTDALYVEGGDAWVGCGTTTEGVGLFTTSNGSDWDEVAGFESFRVSHIHRGADGELYIAGIDRDSSVRVRTIEGDAVFEATNQIWNSFHVGTYLNLDGLEIAESLTGSGLAVRQGPEWMDGDGWPTDGAGYQILDADVWEGRVVAVGSTIIQPPSFFAQTDASGFSMDPIALDSFEGELWSLDADAGLIAGGVDQDDAVGVVFWADAPEGPWSSLRIDTLMEDPNESTWIRGVCRSGDQLTAVGEKSALGIGLVFQSNDGGATWEDVSPPDAPPLSQCVDDGSRRHVAGAQGWYGTL